MKRVLGRFTLGKKIALGYMILLSITLASCLYSIFIFRQSIKTDMLLENSFQPSLASLEELKRLVVRSHRLTNNWIYQPGDEVKTELSAIHVAGFPETRQQINGLKTQWTVEQQLAIEEVEDEVSYLFDVEKKIMTLLANSERYFDSEIIEGAVSELELRVAPTAKTLEIKLSSLILEQQGIASRITEEKYSSFSSVQQIISVSLVVSLLLGTTFAVYSTRAVVRPVSQLRQAVLALGNGELREIGITRPNDEIGDMIESTNMLVRGLKKTTDFTERIASGKFDESYESLSNIRALDEALFTMRNALLSASKMEEKRNWVEAGLARFSDSLRSQDLEELGNNLISYLVAYTSAHLGAIFLVNDDEHTRRYLECKACYAWSENRKIGKRIAWGEGLAGQCWKEGKMIKLNGVPGGSDLISGGLGRFVPQSTVIIPLRVNNQIIGVIEVLSLNPLDEFAIEFLGRACDNAAAAVVGAANTAQMKQLLCQSQMQTEQLMAQEEEMRQMLEQSRTQTEQLLKQEEELRKNHKELQETTRINTKLLSVISHDIKGPFATIKGLLQLYNRGLVSTNELKSHMANVETLIAGTDMLFSNILQWSVHYLNNQVALKSVNLHEAVDQNISLFRLAAGAKGNQLLNQVDKTVVLQADESVVNLLLRNFISNAVKFTENGLIKINANKNQNIVNVSVQDTGAGMSQGDIDRLFDWERKHSTIGTRSEKGAGVGLLICKEFIESYGGELSCTSQLGAGTTFSFSLPLILPKSSAAQAA